MNFRKKPTIKDKAVPFAAGAAVAAGTMVGIATARALSDKKNRKKIIKNLNSVKKQAVVTVSDLVEKRGEMIDMVREKAKDVLPKKALQQVEDKAQRKTSKKIKVVRKAVNKNTLVTKVTKPKAPAKSLKNNSSSSTVS